MSRPAVFLRKSTRPQIDPAGVLNAIPDPVLVIGGAGDIRYVNLEAQEFFEAGATLLIGLRLDEILPADSPIFFLIDQVRAGGAGMSEYGVTLETPRIGQHLVTVRVVPLGEPADCVVMTLHERSITRKIDNQLTHRSAARSVSAMAAMLAHEVKNPLSGIRGAAQLLDEDANEGDRELTRLIIDEADRIVALVDRMEVFSTGGRSTAGRSTFMPFWNMSARSPRPVSAGTCASSSATTPRCLRCSAIATSLSKSFST